MKAESMLAVTHLRKVWACPPMKIFAEVTLKCTVNEEQSWPRGASRFRNSLEKCLAASMLLWRIWFGVWSPYEASSCLAFREVLFRYWEICQSVHLLWVIKEGINQGKPKQLSKSVGNNGYWLKTDWISIPKVCSYFCSSGKFFLTSLAPLLK